MSSPIIGETSFWKVVRSFQVVSSLFCSAYIFVKLDKTYKVLSMLPLLFTAEAIRALDEVGKKTEELTKKLLKKEVPETNKENMLEILDQTKHSIEATIAKQTETIDKIEENNRNIQDSLETVDRIKELIKADQ